MGGRGGSSGIASKTGNLTIFGENIIDSAKQYLKKYKFVGIRTQEETFSLGDMSHESHTWKNGDDTGKKIGGVSATNVKSEAIAAHSDIKKDYSQLRKYKNSGYYYGDNAAIIVSNSAKRGRDVGEIIMENPKVVKIFRRKKK